jgi:hypothetical protein
MTVDLQLGQSIYEGTFPDGITGQGAIKMLSTVSTQEPVDFLYAVTGSGC